MQRSRPLEGGGQGVFVVQVVVAIGIVLATVLVAAGRGDGLSPSDVARRRTPRLPADRPLEVADLSGVRLGVGLRGYRMDEVDDLLDRLTIELAERDERIAELERLRQIATVPSWTPPTGATVEPADASAPDPGTRPAKRFYGAGAADQPPLPSGWSALAAASEERSASDG